MITIHDLVVGFIENERYRGYPEEVTNYYSKKLAILKALFACPLNVSHADSTAEHAHTNNVVFISEKARWEKLINEEPTWSILEQRWFEECIRLAALEKNPFRYVVHLCGLPSDFEAEYNDHFDEHAKALEELYIRVATKLLMVMFLGIEVKTFTTDDLVARGLAVTPPDILSACNLLPS